MHNILYKYKVATLAKNKEVIEKASRLKLPDQPQSHHPPAANLFKSS